ncbi:MAG: putative monooxygenase [Gammaproteobacteria bacterium]|nr:putative monooxygenase [Gammaproteobacteria bacterium]
MPIRDPALQTESQAGKTTGEHETQTLSGHEAALLEKYRIERAKRIRTEGLAQFRKSEGELAYFLEDPYARTPLQRAPMQNEVDVVIVGGGWSGMLTAIHLRQAGVKDIAIIESGGDFGGVWYWNRYPGCRCDVDSFIYMPLLEETGYMPTEKYAKSEEIRAHAQAIARQYDLYRHAVFQTRVTELRWDEEAARWIISTDRKDAIKSRFAFVGNGALNYPKLPGIPGIETFKGHSFHSSRWDYAYTGGDANGDLVNLKDRRVALIGTGSSGVQCVAPLSQWTKQLYVVQRTPAVVSIRGNKPTDPSWVSSLKAGWAKQRMANFDGILAGLVRDEDLVDDEWTDLWGPPPPPPAGADLSELAAFFQKIDIEKMDRVRARVDSIVKDPATAEALKPWYNRFCKRPTFNDDYLPAFNRPNVKLVDTQGRGLDRITENAIVFDGRSYEVDCIIYATGFDLLTTSHKAGGFEIFGRGGQTIDQKWAMAVRSLHGIYTHGFPNLLFVAGMRQGCPTVNFPYMTNEQAFHAAQVVKRLLQDNVRVMEVTPEAENRWCEIIAAKSKVNVEYIRACTPSFLNAEGDLSELPKQAFPTAYGGGPFEYIDILRNWRERGLLDDLHLVRE